MRQRRKPEGGSVGRFRDLLDAFLEATVLVENGIVLEGNRTLYRLFGYEGDDLRGRPLTDLLSPDIRVKALERIRNRSEGRFESLGMRKDGGLFPIAVSAREVEVDGHHFRVSAIIDLTERKEAERQLKAYQEHLERLVHERTEELRKSEEKYRNIFENAVEGIFQTTPDGRFLSANPALASIWAFDNAEEFKKAITDIGKEIYVCREKRFEFEEIMEKEGVARNFELETKVRNGSTKWISLNARAVRDETGKIQYYEGTLEDITERRHAEEALREAEKKYRNIFLNATEGIFQITPRGKPLSVNPAFARIHGFDSSEELMKQVTDIAKLHVSRARRAFYMDKLREEGHVRDFEFRVYRKDGSIAWVSVNARAVRDETGEILYHEGTVQDITERKRAEEALEIKSRGLEEANTALKVLLKHREEDRRELEERFLFNVKQLVLPYVDKLKKSRLDTIQRTELDFIGANLREIVSPFLNNMRGFNFTPRQLEIIALIKDGRTTKEIAEVLHVGKGAIDLQRFLIRKRLGINKDKSNLRSYLLSLA